MKNLKVLLSGLLVLSFLSFTRFWNFEAQTTADTALENSAKMESPAVLKTLPSCSSNNFCKIFLQALKLWSVSSSSFFICCEYPTTSATNITAILRSISFRDTGSSFIVHFRYYINFCKALWFIFWFWQHFWQQLLSVRDFDFQFRECKLQAVNGFI